MPIAGSSLDLFFLGLLVRVSLARLFSVGIIFHLLNALFEWGEPASVEQPVMEQHDNDRQEHGTEKGQ